MARPSSYTVQLADEICDRLIEGESMYQICQSDHMPFYTTIWRWQEAHPDFAKKCARARVLQGEFMDHKVLETAENCKSKDDSYAARVKIAAYQWRAMKLDPKKYGVKEIIDLTVGKAVVKRDPAQTEAKRTKAKEEFSALTNGKANGVTH